MHPRTFAVRTNAAQKCVPKVAATAGAQRGVLAVSRVDEVHEEVLHDVAMACIMIHDHLSPGVHVLVRGRPAALESRSILPSAWARRENTACSGREL